MPTQFTNSGDLMAGISADLADNNAGLISAYDVRHNMEDTVFSLQSIIVSGDTEGEFPFFNAVKFSMPLQQLIVSLSGFKSDYQSIDRCR